MHFTAGSLSFPLKPEKEAEGLVVVQSLVFCFALRRLQEEHNDTWAEIAQAVHVKLYILGGGH